MNYTGILTNVENVKRFRYKLYILSGQVYNKLEYTYCSPDYYGVYNSVEDAKDACLLDSNCKSVYNYGCDDSFSANYLCAIGSSYYTSTLLHHSCIYEKLGI